MPGIGKSKPEHLARHSTAFLEKTTGSNDRFYPWRLILLTKPNRTSAGHAR